MRRIKEKILIGLLLTLSVVPIASGTAKISTLGDTIIEGPTYHSFGLLGFDQSQTYYLTNGDFLWINITIVDLDGLAPENAYIDVAVYTPDGKKNLGRTDETGVGQSYCRGWYIVPDIDTAGNCFLEIMAFLPLSKHIDFYVTYGYYENDVPSGTIDLTNYDKLSGNTSISWDFSDSTSALWYCISYIDGWIYDYGDRGTEIYRSGGSIVYWDTTILTDGRYTFAFEVWEFYDCFPHRSAVLPYCYYVNVYIDNINDPPLLDFISYWSTDTAVEIRYDAIDFNEDTLLYSIYYATDGVNFINNLVIGTTNTEYSWDTSIIPTGDNYAFKIVVADEHGLEDSFVSLEFSISGNEDINLLTPIESITNTALQTITVDSNFDGSVELFVNDVSKGSQTIGFSWDVFLSEGQNELRAVGTNILGTTFNDSHIIELDSQAPIVTINSPEALSYPTSVVVYYSKNEIADIETFLNGLKVENIFNGTILQNLADGAYNLTLVAIDPAGNIGKDTVIFNIDTTPPEIDILSPHQLETTNDIKFLFSTSEEIVDITIEINGLEYSELENGSTINLLDGTYTLSITVHDKAGNMGQAVLIFTIDTTITLPVTTSTTSTSTSSEETTTSDDKSETADFVALSFIALALVGITLKRWRKREK